MGLASASLQRGSNGGFKAFSSYRNDGNEIWKETHLMETKNPSLVTVGGGAPAKPDFPTRASPSFFKLF